MKKVIFITGASSGIGKATSLFFANHGWNVIATMRNPEQEQELSEIPDILLLKLDVTDIKSVNSAVKQSIKKFGQIDVLLNNAGYGQQGLFEAISPAKILKQFDVNVFGLMGVTRAVLPHFRKRKQGAIINITSGVGRVTIPLVSIYAASKFAIEGFSEALSYELESQNIKVRIIEPGYISTPFYERAKSDFAFDPLLEDYSAFQQDMNNLFSSFDNPNAASAQDVAQTVFKAATDDGHQLRYIIGPDLQPLIDLRNSKSDQKYIEAMREQFMPKAFDKNH
jgi:NAD(P)-dependent dehydrogenase (short-subunit alcohol dehydrogenase family)